MCQKRGFKAAANVCLRVTHLSAAEFDSRGPGAPSVAVFPKMCQADETPSSGGLGSCMQGVHAHRCRSALMLEVFFFSSLLSDELKRDWVGASAVSELFSELLTDYMASSRPESYLR